MEPLPSISLKVGQIYFISTLGRTCYTANQAGLLYTVRAFKSLSEVGFSFHSPFIALPWTATGIEAGL